MRTPSFLRKALFVTSIGLLPNVSAWADSSDAFLFFQEEAQVITTASKRTEKAADAPATVLVINKNDIRVRGYENLKDVLRDLPGMETDEFYLSEQGTLVPVRGVAGNNKIVVLVNGMRVNPPGGEDMMFRSDFSVREAEQIEVIYGPGSTLYGQDAISAVINVITKKPEEKHQASVNASVGNHSYKNGGLSFRNQWNGVALSLYGQIHHSGLTDFSSAYPDWWNNHLYQVALPKGEGIVPDRWEHGYNAFLRLEGSQNSFQYWHRESSRSSSEGGYAPVLGFIDKAIWHDRSDVLEAKNIFAISDRLKMESSVQYSRYEIDPESRYVFPASTNAWFLDDHKYGIGKGVTIEEKASADVTDAVHLTAGITVSEFDIVPKATVPGGIDVDQNLTEQGGNFEYYTQLGVAGSLVTVPRVNNLKYRTYGGYLESQWQALDALKLIAGGRVDTNSRYSTTPFSPRGAVIYKVNSRLTTKYIYTRAFVSPAPYFGYNIFDNGTHLNVANTDLNPERAESHEMNVTYSEENTLLSASAYFNKQENLVLIGDRALPANIIQNVVYLDLAGTQTRQLTRTVNGGESKTRGFDLYGRYRLGSASFWTSYSYVDFSENTNGTITKLPQISRHNVRWGVTIAALRNLYMTPSVVFRTTPENMTPLNHLSNEIRNPYEINLHLLYETTQQLSFFANFKNLTDNRYALRGIIGPNPQEAFRAAIGAEWKF